MFISLNSEASYKFAEGKKVLIKRRVNSIMQIDWEDKIAARGYLVGSTHTAGWLPERSTPCVIVSVTRAPGGFPDEKWFDIIIEPVKG